MINPATRPSARRLMLALSLLAAGLGYVAVSPAVAQSLQTKAPTNVSATAGDTEATITWQLGGTHDGGACGAERHWVRVSDGTTHAAVAVSAMLGPSVTSWHVRDLTAGTNYYVKVWAHRENDCGYSPPGTTRFTTNASDAPGDPSAAAQNGWRAPRNVRRVAVTTSGTSATVTWQAPGAPGHAKRCAAGSEYSWRLENLTTGAPAQYESVTETLTALTDTLTGLTVGNEYKITVYVHSSNSNCSWSRGRSKIWTQ